MTEVVEVFMQGGPLNGLRVFAPPFIPEPGETYVLDIVDGRVLLKYAE